MLNNQKKWYALRVTYGREMKLKHHLDTCKIESFLPMRYHKATTQNGQQRCKLVPAIHNLLFIRSFRDELDPIKRQLEPYIPFRYIMNPVEHTPIVVPDKQMSDFIAVSGTAHEQLMYLHNAEMLLSKGEQVRVIGGAFSGVEGFVVRIKKDRRVVVVIQGIAAVATTFIHPSLLERVG